jgi:hypothetical protein
MKYRFFSRMTPLGEHIKLFVLAENEEKEELHEVLLKDGKFFPTSELMRNIVDGFQDMKEISQKDAIRFYEEDGFKEAFQEDMDWNDIEGNEKDSLS